MFRVYCKIGRYRYYWSKAHIWTMWSRAAKSLGLTEARKVAHSENGRVELFSGRQGS